MDWFSEWVTIVVRGNKLDASIQNWYFAMKRNRFFGRNLRTKQHRIAQRMVRRW